ncbi:MAG: hypothetical protein ACXWB5_03145, partial [Kaistella sp.]
VQIRRHMFDDADAADNFGGAYFSTDVVPNQTTDVYVFYRDKLDEIQKGLAGFEKVKKFVLMPAEFEINTGEITPTLKVKRNVVMQKYAELIDKMYAA